MCTYVVELDHGRTRTLSEVDALTPSEAVRTAREMQGEGRVVSAYLKSGEDNLNFPACHEYDFAA